MKLADVPVVPDLGPTGLPIVSEPEIACGWLYGRYPDDVDVDEPADHQSADPRSALRGVVRAALLRPPCIVSFSGGRDSSIVLAVAVDVATQESLELPIALTFRYAGDASAEESSYQESVIGHLQATGCRIQWVHEPITDEFDLLGPLTGPTLRAHGGPTWPAALGATIALTERARGGSVLTGEFGDEVLGAHRMTYLRAAVRRHGRGLTRDDWRAIGEACLPPSLFATTLNAGRSRTDTSRPWLRPAVQRACSRLDSREQADRPLRWDHAVRQVMRRKTAVVGNQTLDALASRADCLLVHPLGDRTFVEAFARHGGRRGIDSRSAATRMLSAGLLPESVVRRRSKSTFNQSRFGPATRAFIRSWDGSGLDPAVVDPDVLKGMWDRADFPAQSAMLLQQAWLKNHERKSAT